MNFRPAPWRLESEQDDLSRLIGDDGRTLFEIRTFSGTYGDLQLLAAAPDLADAAREVFIYLITSGSTQGDALDVMRKLDAGPQKIQDQP